MAPPISARAALEQAGSRLVWTDYLFLTATVAAAVTAVDPLELGLVAEPWTRHLALALTLPAVLLTAIGRGLRLPRQSPAGASSPAALLWPLLLLAALVLGGSLHARLLQGIQSTFLNVGLYMLTAWCAATMVLRTGAPDALLRGYFRVLLAAAVVMSGFLIANAGVRQVYFGGELEAGVALSGEVAGRIESVEPVADLVARTVREFFETVETLGRRYPAAPAVA